MNDFTKEELLNIYLLCNTFLSSLVEVDRLMSPDEINLLNKLQSLIDNHCENDWKERFAKDIYYLCPKCGAEKI